MIHFVFSESDTRYLFLKYDSEYDEINLNKLKDHINLTDPICYLSTYHGPPFTQDFLYTYVRKGLRNPHCMKVPNVKMPRYYHAKFHHKKVFSCVE